jgi:hypothetical protein
MLRPGEATGDCSSKQIADFRFMGILREIDTRRVALYSSTDTDAVNMKKASFHRLDALLKF